MRKVAFLVANDTFPKDPTIPPLRFTQNDARELAEVLEDRETCNFETRLYLNRPSQEVLTGLEQISGELGQDDTLLFYYSGHGKLRQNELCLVSNETVTTILGATSIRTRLVLEYLRGSLARRRILILDCCHSGAIARDYKAVDSKSALDGLADSFGSYILTASTSIELAEEREKDGHGVFTKALIDCLREGRKESITVDDWYEYAYKRVKVGGSQTPLKWGLQEEGPSFEIANFKVKHERLRREEEDQLISTAGVRLNALLASGALTGPRVRSAMRLLESDETTLFPYEQERRDKLKRYLKGDLDLFDAFGNLPAQVPPEFPAVDRAKGSREGASGSGEPRKPKFLPRSATLLVSAVLAFTVLVIVLGAVFREQAGRFLHQASTTISPSGGMPATRDKIPGVPAATPDKTPASPGVIEVRRDRAGSDEYKVALAEQAERAAREATGTNPKPESVKLVPDDIRKLLSHRGHALLIGVSDYKAGWPPLPNVKYDLQDLKAGLAPHFQTVEIEQNPTMAQLRQRMREFLLDQWNNPDERLFIYYSGHGFTDFNQSSRQNDGYITGSDTPVYNPNYGRAIANAVPFTEVESWSRQTKALHVLMVFDSTFSGSLFQTIGAEQEPRPNDLDNVRTLLRKPMRYYITAGRQNEEVAADSTFAKLLLRGLRGEADVYHAGIISADDLGSYLYHEVPKYSQRPQTPQFKSIGNARLSEGQFFFLTAPTAAGPSAPLAIAPLDVPPTGATANRPGTANNKSGTK